MTKIPTNGNGNSVHNRKRDGGRAVVYFGPDMKDWLAQHAKDNGRSLSGMVDHICTEYAKDKGYQEPAPMLELKPVEPTPQDKPNLDTNQINQLGQLLGQQLATTLTEIFNGVKCLI